MKKSNSNTSTEKQNTETNIRAELTSKSLNEISCLAKQSDADTKTDKKTNKFDKTTQSFSPQINHNKQTQNEIQSTTATRMTVTPAASSTTSQNK